MIPLKLHIKNFLSYSSLTQVVDFAPYHLICLSGKNGHGKSALLDAITWVLWGQARKVSGTSKADEGLLRLGQTHMMVSLDFMSAGQTYRVRREFSIINGKPHAQLDFGVVNQETSQMRALSDKTIRATQEKIIQTIGLDYDACVNSIFLRQGQSNEFSKKAPKERKEILTAILGIGHYEIIKKRAQEKSRDALIAREQLQKLHEKTTEELSHKESIIAQLVAIEAQLVQYAQHEQVFVQRRTELDVQFRELAALQQIQAALRMQHDQYVVQLYALKSSITELVVIWRTTLRKQRSLSKYAEHEELKRTYEKELSAIQTAMAQRLSLKEKILMAQETEQKTRALREKEAAMQQAQYALAMQQQHLVIKALEKQLQEQETLCATIDSEQEKLRVQLGVVIEIAVEEKLFERRKNTYHAFIAQVNMLTHERTQLGQKSTLASSGSEEPCCPLCEQNLSASRKRFLQAKFGQQIVNFSHRIVRLHRVIPALKQVLVEQHARLELLKKYTQNEAARALHIFAIAQLQKELGVTRLNFDTAEQVRDSFEKEYTVYIDQDASYAQCRAMREKLVSAYEKLFYDADRHAAVQVQLEKLAAMQADYVEVLKNSALQQQRKDEIQMRCREAKVLCKSITELVKQLVAESVLQERSRILEGAFADCAHESAQLQQGKEGLMQQKGAGIQQKMVYEQREREHAEQQAIILMLTKEVQEYQAIAQALGKDGIQALLIEHAIPEIEQEANNLLEKLTDNQAHLSIESLRDLKSGATKETLDIKISDAAGIRPYELFSGGEAFRIDFALRIAISKLLARRSGTSLQTLIIDEGFGSQDEEGLSAIMEALYKIQGDFAKIIIVSHLSSMKDQFPVHFVVHKGSRGSTVHTIEHD